MSQKVLTDGRKATMIKNMKLETRTLERKTNGIGVSLPYSILIKSPLDSPPEADMGGKP